MFGIGQEHQRIAGLPRLGATAGALSVGFALAFGFVAIRAGGGTGEFNPQLMYAAIVPAAVWFGPAGGLAAGVVAGLLTGPAMPLQTEPYVNQEFWDWFPRTLYFSGVGAAVGFFNHRLARQSVALAESAKWLLTMTAEAMDARRAAERNAGEAERLARAHAQGERELQIVHQVDEAILRGAGENDIYALVLESAVGIMGGHRGLIWLVKEVGGSHIAEVYPPHPERRAQFRRLLATMRPGEGTLGWAILNNQTSVSEDVSADPRYARLRQTIPNFKVGATISAPITVSGRVAGAITIGYPDPRKFSQEEIDRITRFAGQLSVAIEHARQQESLKNMTLETVVALAESIESRDPYTGGHCMRLVQYAELLAREIGLSGSVLEVVRFGAALHDSGKVGVPDAILKKPGPLTPDEWAHMKLHPYIGAQLCKKVSFLGHIYPIVYHHHERWDGSGYPDGLAGEDIPLPARIVTIADAYDAMTNDRPYRRARGHDYAVSELRRHAGQQFDPALVEKFVAAIERERSMDGPDVRAIAA